MSGVATAAHAAGDTWVRGFKGGLIAGVIAGFILCGGLMLGLNEWSKAHPTNFERWTQCTDRLMWQYHYRLPPEPEATKLLNGCQK